MDIIFVLTMAKCPHRLVSGRQCDLSYGIGRFPRLLLAGMSVLVVAPANAAAQSSHTAWAETFSGSPTEEYLRLLQVAGMVEMQPWGLRPFGPQQLARLTPASDDHPWAQRIDFTQPRSTRPVFALVRPATEIRLNSAFPAGSNDGPTWAGRGLTVTLAGGFATRAGPLSLVLAPTWFHAQNSSFTLQPNGQSGDLVYADARFPTGIDRPQAFGDGSYSRLDPGESTLRLDALGIAAGISSASQWWGPAAFHPVLLGTNAGGFPHAFFGTARPVSLRVIRLHGRLNWGRLDQSRFSPVTGSEYFRSIDEPGTRRFMAGLVLTAEPTFLPGLELGLSRFFHEGWPEGGLTGRHFRLPIETLFKQNIVDTLVATGQNQLLSVFARWVVPSARLEVYAERGKDDHSWDARDLILETEHSASTTFGMAKVWPGPGRLTALRAEVINYQSPANAALRLEPGFYPHSVLRQGHTHRGQLLGTNVGAGSGSGAIVSVERYTRRGKLGISLARDQVDRPLRAPATMPESEVKTTLQLEAIRFAPLADITARVGLTDARRWNFSSHTTNLSFMLGARAALPGRSRARPGT